MNNYFGNQYIKNKKNNQNPIESIVSDSYDLSYRSSELNNSELFSTEKKSKKIFQRKEFTVFNYSEYYEQEIIKKEIDGLLNQIRQEIQLIKKADNSLAAEVKDVENLTINASEQKPGIYHVRFLEIVLRLLKSLREKISESKTWLSAMVSRRKKRGSLFASLSKKKGTQYSLSQELQLTRSVQ